MIEVLHVASFSGNIGDNANHNGTYSTLSGVLSDQISLQKSEIRKYYYNYNKPDSKSFDDTFIEIANNKDLVIIGGGSYFDPHFTKSKTGTTIDISNSQIDDINTPIVFHGLGCIPNQFTSESVVKKFGSFLNHVTDANHCLVSVRNDGSRRHITKLLGNSYANRIEVIPDGGFFINTQNCQHPEISNQGITIGINLVSDLQKQRFPGRKKYFNYEAFIMEFSTFADSLLETNPSYNILFIPHIYSDLTAISDVLQNMDIVHRRNRVTTAPYLHGMGKEKYIFNLYNSVDIAMGLRFHANVCSIGLNTPSIGLINGHPKVGDLYNSIGLSNRCISVHDNQFTDDLSNLVQASVRNAESIKQEYQEKVTLMHENLKDFHKKIASLIE